MSISEETLTNAGERMIVGNMWGYWEHLSIYCFALPFAAGRRVLDAGSGAGYGAAYLARHGAQVLPLDAGAVAIQHSRERYAGDPVTFEVADLNAPLPAGDEVFDLVFSSNVFEHVARVDLLAAECARVLKPDGVAVIAVPPICSAMSMAADMENQFHVHHIPPSAWEAKLRRSFHEVTLHNHCHAGDFANPVLHEAQMRLPPDQVTIRETDFAFTKMTAAAMDAGGSITAVFVCRGRRLPAGEETLAERTPSNWCEGTVAARLIGQKFAVEERVLADEQQAVDLAARLSGTWKAEAELRAQLVASQADVEAGRLRATELLDALSQADAARTQAQQRVAAIEASTSWRVTRPMRALRQGLHGRG